MKSAAPLELATLFEYRNREKLDALDWVGVAHMDLGSGYEWNEFAVWYSPSERRYFWLSGSGCSCNAFGDSVYSKDDFENGTKKDAIAAGNRFCDESYGTAHVSESVVLSHTISAFRPSVVQS